MEKQWRLDKTKIKPALKKFIDDFYSENNKFPLGMHIVQIDWTPINIKFENADLLIAIRKMI